MRSSKLWVWGVGLGMLLAGSALGQDPAVVNAATIRVALEKPRVRVLEATLEPGHKEQVHSHPRACST